MVFKVGNRYKNKATGNIYWCTYRSLHHVYFGASKSATLAASIRWPIWEATSYWIELKETKTKVKFKFKSWK